MTLGDRVDRIREARRLLAEARDGCDAPQIDTLIGEADMHLHWALWNLGEPVALRPELSD